MNDTTQAVETLQVALDFVSDLDLPPEVWDNGRAAHAALGSLVARIAELERHEAEAIQTMKEADTTMRAGIARIAELEGEYEALRETDLDHGLRLLRETELRAELNTTRNALHLAVAENTELRAALERKRALVAALYDHVAATGSADGEPLRLLLADHVSAHPQETEQRKEDEIDD